MSAALAPVFVGREVFETEADSVVGRLARSAGRALLALGEFGAGTFSRGREFAADRGAAHITGEPAALASALETLSADRARPAADLRDGDPAVTALNVVPRATDRGGSFDSHPETAARIARLRGLERAQETS
jgi:heat shock protein HtpX